MKCFGAGPHLTVVAVVLSLSLPSSYGQSPTSQPVPSHDQLFKELNAQEMALLNAIPDDEKAYRSPDERAKVGRTVIPIVKKILRIIDQLPPNCRGQSMSAMKTIAAPPYYFAKNSDHAPVRQDVAKCYNAFYI